MADKKKITIAIPVCNEALILPELHARVKDVMISQPSYIFEVIFLDNGSDDNSGEACKEICLKEQDSENKWKYVRFSRNFGIEASFFAGAHYCSGDALIYLFSDMQDPPEMIPTMIEKWEAGNDLVYGVLKKRQDHTFTKSLGAVLAYRIIFYLSDVKIPVNATDFRLLSRVVVDAMKSCNERNRYMRGITHWTGFKHATFEFDRSPRKFGETKAGLAFCIKYAFSAIFSFSAKPVRIASILGIVTTLMSVFGIVFYTILTILIRSGVVDMTPPPPGYTTMLLLIFFFGGVQCLFLGILGEYITQILTETKMRPIWISHEEIGFN
jgi:dolichol-phosphate mannosyltransferase